MTESNDDLVVVTGMTGAGRSTAAKVLEDLGYFVIDNIPPQLLPEVLRLIQGESGDLRIAVVVDVRSRWFFTALEGALEDLAARGNQARLLFLEASDEVLVRRQDAARRPHPLQGTGRLLDGIEREREMLRGLRGAADVVIDTSTLNVHQMAERVVNAFAQTGEIELTATVMSFGFKYGIPVDADMVTDMRFLPNPHWVGELRPRTGLDREVSEYVLEHPDATEFLDKYQDLLKAMSAGYLREGKRFMTIAVGCTGGKHRSISMAEALAARLRGVGVETLVVHRDLGRE